MQTAISGVSRAELERFTTRARRAVGLRGEANILVGGNAELRRLNREFRRKDKPTDVLSFPAVRGKKVAKGEAGDIAISATIAQANARRLGHSTARELKILILHGLLHLAGYDHEKDSGEMRRQEDRLRARLGLPVALISRSATPSRKKAGRQ
ncbi:MAG: rRNA maturation RNase YbeY [Candidatus Koribacter versatilis]|uniref:Endoribonuclease YbeY n=1 Tax=Candidatus Korobacter versatilis TaxID=658062 RepID=A0A932A735_9BACT|nr:rRNA maturation RNase YbeY [Candidatus Koribacter versatilis]